MEIVSAVTGVVAVGFLLMALVAFASPATVVAYFGVTDLTIDGRNEVRAVYGGFGVVIAGLVAVAPYWPGALFGMALGRGISRGVDGGAGFYPWLFFSIEVAAGAALVAALMALP
jgi:hypothetical protein